MSWKKVFWKTAYWLFGLFLLLLLGFQALFYLSFGSWLVALPFVAYFLIVLIVQGTILIATVAGLWGPLWVKSKAHKMAKKIERSLFLPGLFLFGLTILWQYLLEGGIIWLTAVCVVWIVIVFLFFVGIYDYIQKIRTRRMIESSYRLTKEYEEPAVAPIQANTHIKERS